MWHSICDILILSSEREEEETVTPLKLKWGIEFQNLYKEYSLGLLLNVERNQIYMIICMIFFAVKIGKAYFPEVEG